MDSKHQGISNRESAEEETTERDVLDPGDTVRDRAGHVQIQDEIDRTEEEIDRQHDERGKGGSAG